MSPYFIAPRAQRDMREIWLRIADDSVAAADRMIDALLDRYQKLARMPHMGRMRTDLGQPRLRSYPVRKYVVFYEPFDGYIEIVRVIHGSRNLPDALE